MNLIPKIAEMLGVEVGEEFRIKSLFNEGLIYKFDGTGLFVKSDTMDSIWSLTTGFALRDILIGVVDIEKIPFEPKEGERYWYVYWGTEHIRVTGIPFEDDDMHYHHKYCGNCFRTETEAEKHKYEIYEKLTGRKWEEKCED